MRLPRKYKKECLKEAKKLGYIPIITPNNLEYMTKEIWDLFRYQNHGSNFKIQ